MHSGSRACRSAPLKRRVVVVADGCTLTGEFFCPALGRCSVAQQCVNLALSAQAASLGSFASSFYTPTASGSGTTAGSGSAGGGGDSGGAAMAVISTGDVLDIGSSMLNLPVLFHDAVANAAGSYDR